MMLTPRSISVLGRPRRMTRRQPGCLCQRLRASVPKERRAGVRGPALLMRCLLVSPDLVLLPGEKGRGFSEDLFLLLENPILAAKPTELFSLLGGQSFPLSLIDLCLLNPATQRVVRDAKLPGYLGDAPVRRGADKADGLSFEFRRVAWCRSRHCVDSLHRHSYPKLWFVRRPGSSPKLVEALAGPNLAESAWYFAGNITGDFLAHPHPRSTRRAHGPEPCAVIRRTEGY